MSLIKRIVLVMACMCAPLVGLGGGGDDRGAAERSARYLASVPDDAQGAFGAVARLASNRSMDLAGLRAGLQRVNSRRDCSDFVIAGMLRLMYLYGDDPRMPADAKKELTDTILHFKYWIDEPGHDSMCYWSENHQVLYHSDEYLAGALFPDRVFPNSGMTGKEHVAKGRRLLEQWLGWREKFGFSEWMSNVYFDEELYPLLNLVDFAPDPEIRKRAAMAVDQVLLNIALNSFRGNFTCTHGRTYENNVLSARNDDVRQALYVLFGVPAFDREMAVSSKSGVAAATSSYRLPAAIYNIARDRSVMENYQHLGVSIEGAQEMGIALGDVDNGMFFWGMGMYTHPKLADTTARMWKQYDLYDNMFFLGLARPAVWLSSMGRFDDFLSWARPASEGAYLANAYTYTFRTPDYILSTALDRNKGRIGAQSLMWEAGLGADAVVFTTHPGRVVAGGSPGKWTGNGANPRAAQYKNVMVAIYNAPNRLAMGELFRVRYTHAWFPRDAFDRVEQRGNWTFGKKDDGYVALYSLVAPKWVKSGKHAGKELRAGGLKNIWICEMGRAGDDGSFDEFVEKVAAAKVDADSDLNVRYDSPNLGEVEFGWTGPFTVAGQEMDLRRDMRYDNPYVKAPSFSERLEIESGGDSLVLDFAKGERTISGAVER